MEQEVLSAALLRAFSNCIWYAENVELILPTPAKKYLKNKSPYKIPNNQIHKEND